MLGTPICAPAFAREETGWIGGGLPFHNKLWKILKEMGIRDHLTCLLRNLYAGQEVRTAVRTGHGTTDCF